MSLFRTKTPYYVGKGESPTTSETFDLCKWLTSLIHTPTPTYSSPPSPDDGDGGDGGTCATAKAPCSK